VEPGQPDGRVQGLRGEHRGVRVECRVGGADLNPYLALAGQLAAGLAGLQAGLELEPEMAGDMYAATHARPIPRSLREAAEAMDGSQMLREAMGDEVVDHYVHAARWEVSESDRVVTDWDLQRGFERL
jgi:glutamine synthetase